jgi:hypothetical protein
LRPLAERVISRAARPAKAKIQKGFNWKDKMLIINLLNIYKNKFYLKTNNTIQLNSRKIADRNNHGLILTGH